MLSVECKEGIGSSKYKVNARLAVNNVVDSISFKEERIKSSRPIAFNPLLYELLYYLFVKRESMYFRIILDF